MFEPNNVVAKYDAIYFTVNVHNDMWERQRE